MKGVNWSDVYAHFQAATGELLIERQDIITDGKVKHLPVGFN